jgi:hypothetical protein
MICETKARAAANRAATAFAPRTPGLGTAAVVLCAALLAGCSSASIGSPGSPSYLGARDVTAPAPQATTTTPRVTSSKVISAVVFERVTGLEVDPATLIDR